MFEKTIKKKRCLVLWPTNKLGYFGECYTECRWPPQLTHSLSRSQDKQRATEVELRLFWIIRSTRLCISIMITAYKRPSIIQSSEPSDTCRGCAGTISYYSCSFAALESQHFSCNYITLTHLGCGVVVAGASGSTPCFTAAVHLMGGTLEVLQW